MAYGGPEGPDDVLPYLEHVLAGKRVPQARMDEVAEHYLRFGGVSPLPELTRRQATSLQRRLQEIRLDMPVYVGMVHWHPFIADTLAGMSRAGVRRAIGFVMAAYQCDASCAKYRRTVAEGRGKLREAGQPDVHFSYVESWYDHPGFIESITRQVQAAIDGHDAAVRDSVRIVFTAHSIPLSMAESSHYVHQLRTTARLVAERLGRRDWALVYQSRSGRPTDPWLEPDICDYLRAERSKGLTAVVLSPIGFVSDHMEVIYDLDVEAADVCRESGIQMVRAETPNDDPMFVEMMADLVRRITRRYKHFPPLPIVGSE